MRMAGWKGVGSAFRVALLLSLLLTAPSEGVAERLSIKTYTTADGMARDHVKRIVQDSHGFLWFGTVEGLSRFDGYRFVNYGKEQGLPSRQVNDFLESRGGIYWVATSEGLCRFNAAPSLQASEGSGAPDSSPRFVVYRPGDTPQKRYISALYEDRAGTIWCGTPEGLYQLDEVNGQWVFSFVDIIRPEKKIADNLLVQAILEDRRGALWASTSSGLYRRRPDGVTEAYADREGLPVPRITSALLEDRDGRIWIGTNGGLYQLVTDPEPNRPVVARVYTTKDGLTSNRIVSLFQSSDGQMWVGTENGLNKFRPTANKDDGRFQGYTLANNLSDVVIRALAEDRDGNLWIGTETGGAMKLALDGFTSYGKADGLGETRIGSIFEDRAGELCVISGNDFINRLDGGKFTAAPLTLPKGITSRGWGWYQTMFQDRAGEWWMSTGGGLVRYPKVNGPGQLTRAPRSRLYNARRPAHE